MNIYNELPDVTYKTGSIIEVKRDNFVSIENLVEEFVGADCFAVVVNDELIFNDYKFINIKHSIDNVTIRNNIINDSHNTIFVHLFRNNVKTLHIKIYMFSSSPFVLNICYNNNIFEVYNTYSHKHCDIYDCNIQDKYINDFRYN